MVSSCVSHTRARGLRAESLHPDTLHAGAAVVFIKTHHLCMRTHVSARALPLLFFRTSVSVRACVRACVDAARLRRTISSQLTLSRAAQKPCHPSERPELNVSLTLPTQSHSSSPIPCYRMPANAELKRLPIDTIGTSDAVLLLKT